MKILIADDSGFVRNIIIKTLSTQLDDLELITAPDGKEALALFQTAQPDLVITDLLMPEMTGQEFLRAAKALVPEIKAIVVSADIQTATRDELAEIGVIEFINKPLAGDKLAQLTDLVRAQKEALC